MPHNIKSDPKNKPNLEFDITQSLANIIRQEDYNQIDSLITNGYLGSEQLLAALKLLENEKDSFQNSKAGSIQQPLDLSLFDCISAPVVVIDELGLISFTNQAFKELFASTSNNAKDLIHISNFLATESRKKLIKKLRLQNFDADIYPILIKGLIFRPSKGNEFLAKLQITRSKNTKDIQLICTIENQQQEYEKVNELQELEKYLDNILNYTSNAIITINEQGKILGCNRPMEILFGYKQSELSGRNVSVLMPPEIAMNHNDFLRNYNKTGYRQLIGTTTEVKGIKKDGSEIFLNLSVSEFFSRSGERIFIGNIIDTTDKRLLEQQLRQSQKMESLGQLSGGIAHDFNNILSIIIGSLDLALTHKTDSFVEKHLKNSLIAAQRGADITKRLLHFSRKSSDLSESVTDVNHQITEVIHVAKGTLPPSIIISTDLKSDLWAANISASEVGEIILNLIINARDAMKGSGKIYITTENISDPPLAKQHDDSKLEFVKICVHDNGSGMDETTRRLIFDPFFTTKDKGKGTGLGLSTVFMIIKKRGGSISVSSTPTIGTSFTIKLPRAQNILTKSYSESAVADSVNLKGNESILMVDDEEGIIDNLSNYLTSLGYQVDAACDVESAKQALSARSYDLILTDAIMPGAQTGVDLIEEYLATHPSQVFILMSGYVEELNKDLKIHTIAKPFRNEELAKRIKDVFQGNKQLKGSPQ